jgi:hypothetical protein
MMGTTTPRIRREKKPRRVRYGQNVVVSCDAELKQWLTALAAAEERPVGALARILLKEARQARENARTGGVE